ncbi:MAG: hypothetical protein ACQERC_02600 [Bacteroidota bacterium]
MALKKNSLIIQVFLVIFFLLFLSISIAILVQPLNVLHYTQYWILSGTAFLCLQSVRMARRANSNRSFLLIFALFNLFLFSVPFIGVFDTAVFESLWEYYFAAILLLIAVDLLLLNRLVSGRLKARFSDLLLMLSFLILLGLSVNVLFQLFDPFSYTAHIIFASFITLSILFKLIDLKKMGQV